MTIKVGTGCTFLIQKFKIKNALKSELLGSHMVDFESSDSGCSTSKVYGNIPKLKMYYHMS